MAEQDIKCVIWDLDNTMWDGVLLEGDRVQLKAGIEGILYEVDRRGIINSISSKNDYESAIQKLRELGVEKYFLYPEINWQAKSISVSNIGKNLNLGLQSLLFIDDQSFERDEVKSEHPEIRTLDAASYLDLLDVPGMMPRFITTDSSKRRRMYVEDQKRREDEKAFSGPKEGFLASLNMKFVISEAKKEDLKRAEELTIRTNQLNATGKTYSYEDLLAYMESEKHRLYICELSDKYGGYGKIGLALVEEKEEADHLRLLLMSCRVMSRGVGTVLLNYIMKRCREQGRILLADFKKTSKNRQMYITYKFEGFYEVDSDDTDNVMFQNDLTRIQDTPAYLKLIDNTLEN